MDFLQLSTLGAIAGTLLMILAYTYLYSLYHERHMKIWIIAWFILLFRIFFFDYEFFNWTSSILGIITYQILQIVLSILFIYSIHLFSNKPFKKYWYYSALFIAFFSVVSTMIHLPLFYKLTLIFLFSSATLIYSCKIFINLETKGIGKYITGGAFALWGGITALYSIAYNSNVYIYLWILLVCGILRLIVTTGMLIVYIEKSRMDLISNQEALQQVNLELQKTNQELNHFCHSVAHDFKSPLQSINKLSKYLIRDYADKVDSNGQELITHIQNKSAEVVDITDHLLELSRMSQKQIAMEDIKLEPLFREVYDELIELQPERQVAFKIKQLPMIHGDPIMIKILVANILSNALKYTRNRKQAIIEVTSVEDENDYIISVKDNGAGFDMSESSRLFQIFERLHSVDQFEGTGVGLVVCQKILKRHNGSAWLKGKVNEGAVFSFSFPKSLLL